MPTRVGSPVPSMFDKMLGAVFRRADRAPSDHVVDRAKTLDASARAHAIAACAEGYSYPTNLDRDPPIGGLAPKTQAQIMAQAVAEGWTTEAFGAALDSLVERRLT